MNSEIKMQSLADFRNSIDETTPARKRISALLDPESFVELDAFAASNGESCGVVTGYGYVDGNPVYVFSQDIKAASGAVTMAHSKKIKKVYELAAKTGSPVVGIYDSNGAKLTEGVDALAAYGEMLASVNNLSGVVPQISLVLGTCAGTAAMMACSADLVVMSKKAEFFLASSGDTAKDSAQAAAKSGTAHLVAENDDKAIEQVKKLLSMLPSNNLSAAPLFDFAAPDTAAAAGSSPRDILAAVADSGSVVELQAEFGISAVTALATVNGNVAGFVATDKENGALCAHGASKIARFVRLCDAFNIPIVTFVDVEGFRVSAESELAGGIREIAKLAHAYAEATTAKVSVITGAAYGSAYVALAGKGANADVVLAWENATVSALNPEASVELFWHDKLKKTKNLTQSRAELAEEYKRTLGSAFEAAKGGHIDAVIDPAETRMSVASALDMLAGKRVSKLPKKHGNMPL